MRATFAAGCFTWTIPSYTKDTTDFLNRLQLITDLPSEMLLVTLDVKPLYTNSEGIEGCRAALNTRQVLQPPTEDLIYLIKLILTKNNSFLKGTLASETWDGYGNMNGPILRQYIHGRLGEKDIR